MRFSLGGCCCCVVEAAEKVISSASNSEGESPEEVSSLPEEDERLRFVVEIIEELQEDEDIVETRSGTAETIGWTVEC